MCTAIPMEVCAINGLDARCSAKGVDRQISLWMLSHEPIKIGDWVLVHLGQAIRKVSPEEARETWALFDQLMDTDESIM